MLRIRIPFFGLVTNRSPMNGLLEHYTKVEIAMRLIEDALTPYINDGDSNSFRNILEQLKNVEEEADEIKRHIRNNTPKGRVLPVDHVLFFNYTRQQDYILSEAQDGLHWLGMRDINIPDEFKPRLSHYLQDVINSIKLLKPALEGTVALVLGQDDDMEGTKELYRTVRSNHKLVNSLQNEMVPLIFNSEMDFKEIYMLIHFVEHMHGMSHNAENCADTLRAMIGVN